MFDYSHFSEIYQITDFFIGHFSFVKSLSSSLAAGKAQQRMQSLLNGLVNPDDETIANEVGLWKPRFMCWSEDVDGSEILHQFDRRCRISSINSVLTLAVLLHSPRGYESHEAQIYDLQVNARSEGKEKKNSKKQRHLGWIYFHLFHPFPFIIYTFISFKDFRLLWTLAK